MLPKKYGPNGSVHWTRQLLDIGGEGYKWPKMHKQTDKSISFGNAGNHVAQLVTHPPSPLSKIRPGPKMPRSLCLRQGAWMQQLKKRCT